MGMEGGVHPNMEAVGEQMMARIMASGGIPALGERGERRRSSGSLGRITPLGRINEDEEERSPRVPSDPNGGGGVEEEAQHRGGGNVGMTVSEEKMVVIKDGKVIEIESGQVLLEGQKVLDLEEGKMVELADGKVVGLEGGKLLEFEGENYIVEDEGYARDHNHDSGKFPMTGRYVVGGEKYTYRTDGGGKHVVFADEKYQQCDVGKRYDNKQMDEDEGYDNVCKESYGGYLNRLSHNQSANCSQLGAADYDQLPYMGQVVYHNPPPNFANVPMGYGRPPNQECSSMGHAVSGGGSMCSPMALVGHYKPVGMGCDYGMTTHGEMSTPAQYKATPLGGMYPQLPMGQQYMHIATAQHNQRQQ